MFSGVIRFGAEWAISGPRRHLLLKTWDSLIGRLIDFSNVDFAVRFNTRANSLERLLIVLGTEEQIPEFYALCRDAVVLLESREARQLVKPAQGTEMAQINKQFEPRVLVVLL